MTAVIDRADDESAPVWLQTSGETDDEYRLFHDYLVAGAMRSVADMYEAHRMTGAFKSKSRNIPEAYRDIVNRNRWVERASAWDNDNFRRMRARHVDQLNKAIDVLFAGSVDAAKTLVAAVTPGVKGRFEGKVDRARLVAACAILDRCGIIARSASYVAPSAINAPPVTGTTQTVTVRFESASKADLVDAAGYDDD